MISGPSDLTVRAWWHALRDAGKAFQAKSLTDNAAALTYYSVLSIFPGLIVLVSLLGVVGSEDSIGGLLRIIDELGSSSAVDTLRPPIENIVRHSNEAGVALVIGVLAALWPPPATSAPSCGRRTRSTRSRRTARSGSCGRCSC